MIQTILQVNQCDSRGGAANMALSLHRACRSAGLSAWMAVDEKTSDSSHVRRLDHNLFRHPLTKLWLKLFGRLEKSHPEWKHQWPFLHPLYWLAQPRGLHVRLAGCDEYDFPATWRALDLPPSRPDILHLHNLHGRYFDLRALPFLSRQVPVAITLHDMWLLTGGCAHSMDCRRWESGCGHCPYLSVSPHFPSDGTAYNRRIKRLIYQKSRLHVAAPSRWLMEKAKKSILAKSIATSRVIPNGVDQDIFRPGPQKEARQALGVPTDAVLLIAAAEDIRRNPFKDYAAIRAALEDVARRAPEKSILFAAIGQEAEPEQMGGVHIRFIPFERDPRIMARWYQSADICLHAAKADTFPTVILESLSCGTPVIATRVGGVPEQIKDGRDGFLVPKGDGAAMARRVLELIHSKSLRRDMGRNARERAKGEFSTKRMTDDYLAWYEEIGSNRNKGDESKHVPKK
ncbi:conserved hypothetical protein [Candidatus Desulfarcum epimagneticum]|uniref:Glycosyltransferase n=1 Tax=uncultured Desulfobacteraceae bacterium TaxID=218296 RepID=A0A484HJN0_9BACT|nr:conserved hypothetical protein [uncultured Desulfobacteraceae bacterium]